jgi:hypothetical protein
MANMELITSVTVGSGGAASVTLPATGTIPQTYTDLYLVMSARSNRSGGQPADGFLIKPNNTTPTIKYISGEGSGTPFSGTSYSGIVPTISATASTFGSCSAYFPNYANTSNHKSFFVDDVSENNGSIAYATLSANLYSSNSAITTIVVESINAASFVEHSTFYLYGISNVTSTTKATGGIVSSDGTYNYHTFPFSGTFTPTAAISADVLCIAGGGGGGQQSGGFGGGGGAGGLQLFTSQSLTATGYTVTVGAGGNKGNNTNGANGGNSQFGSLTASAGGGGGGGYQNNGSSGGSGGGGGGYNTTGGAVSPSGQGNAGGNGSGSSYGPTQAAGGGGGAGAVGGVGSNSSPYGPGGVGLQYLTWANATQTGVDNGYYAGGGGGSNQSSAASGLGGLGGGGKGGFYTPGDNGSNGVANTGGGGGGNVNASGSTGYNGGSGLVIIRYAI